MTRPVESITWVSFQYLPGLFVLYGSAHVSHWWTSAIDCPVVVLVMTFCMVAGLPVGAVYEIWIWLPKVSVSA